LRKTPDRGQDIIKQDELFRQGRAGDDVSAQRIGGCQFHHPTAAHALVAGFPQ